jgi:hypothetical protein
VRTDNDNDNDALPAAQPTFATGRRVAVATSGRVGTTSDDITQEQKLPFCRS